MKPLHLRLFLAAIATAAAFPAPSSARLAPPSTSTGGLTVRASVNLAGADADDWSRYADLSADGGHVVFESLATDLVPVDTNGTRDVFVRDLAAEQTVRASIPAGGGQGNGASTEARISADGRYVAFVSSASNMVSGDTNHVADVFRRDLVMGTTIRVSVAWDGAEAESKSDYPAISADGRFVVFTSIAQNLVPQDTGGFWDVFVRDVELGTTEWISYALGGGKPDGGCIRTDVSDDGRYVAFSSSASNLVTGETSNTLDVYRHDRVTGVTTRMSADQFGGQANNASRVPEISGDGRFVVFESAASDLVPGDTNQEPDCFLHDTLTGLTERVSLGEHGQQANKASEDPSVSADGRFVAFRSWASNLLPVGGPGVKNVYVRDRATGRLQRVSVDASGAPPDGHCDAPSISGDGGVVAFSSAAANLVADDGNDEIDVFAHDLDVASCGVSLASVETPRLGTPPNPAALLPGQTSGPVLGATWDPVIDHGAFLPGASLDLLAVTLAPANVPLAPYGTLLCDVVSSPLFTFSAPAGSAFAIPIPDDCSVAGVPLTSQGAAVDGAVILLTNALDLVVGTF